MLRIAVYCPQFSKEADSEWEKRFQECRRFLRRNYPRAESIELEELPDLMLFHATTPVRRIIVARAGYYSLDFHGWARRNRLEVIDVLALEEEQQPAWIEAMQK